MTERNGTRDERWQREHDPPRHRRDALIRLVREKATGSTKHRFGVGTTPDETSQRHRFVAQQIGDVAEPGLVAVLCNPQALFGLGDGRTGNFDALLGGPQIGIGAAHFQPDAGAGPLLLGFGMYASFVVLPEFETAATGMKAGEKRTFELKFPDDYHSKDVAGKTAAFAVAAKKVEEPRLPALDAESAKQLGVADGDLAKMRSEVRANVEREVKKRVESRLKAQALQAQLDAAPIELPKSLVQMEHQRLVEQAVAELQARGVKLEKMPFDPQAFEASAKRRVALALIIGFGGSVTALAAPGSVARRQQRRKQQPGEGLVHGRAPRAVALTARARGSRRCPSASGTRA